MVEELSEARVSLKLSCGSSGGIEFVEKESTDEDQDPL